MVTRPSDLGAADDQRTVIGAPASPGAALPPGMALQEFVIEGLIGEGGFGIVYLARDTRLDRKVALKEYMPTNLAQRNADRGVTVRSERHRQTFALGLRSFVNEAKLLASFDHPSLVKVYRFWEENGTAYMVMPFYEGPTLRQKLAELGQPPDEAWLRALLAPLIDALELIHNDHCWHRDIAPDNILLLAASKAKAGTGPQLRPLLLDFGAARRVIGDVTHNLTVILKPGYAPIEQYAESASMKQGPWTDVYALCAVLYNAVTGRAPVPSVSRIIGDDMVSAAQAGAGRYSQAFLASIDAGLAVRPDARPQSMAALRERFDISRARSPQNAEPPRSPAQGSAAGPAPATQQTVVMTGGALARGPSIEAGNAGVPTNASRKWPLVLAGGAVVVVAATTLGVGWWQRAGAPRLAQPKQAASAVAAAAPTPPATPADPTAPAAAPIASAEVPATASTAPTASAPAFSVLAVLDDIVKRADPGLAVHAVADKATLTIGRDSLQFRVKSSRAGYVYVFYGDAEKSHFYLLFPNSRDKDNRIDADAELQLPRKGWHITAEGPAGTSHLVALVSQHERDFQAAGLHRTAGLTPEFDLTLARQRWAPGEWTASPFVGRAICDKAPCADAYGAALLEITEVQATTTPNSAAAPDKPRTARATRP